VVETEVVETEVVETGVVETKVVEIEVVETGVVEAVEVSLQHRVEEVAAVEVSLHPVLHHSQLKLKRKVSLELKSKDSALKPGKLLNLVTILVQAKFVQRLAIRELKIHVINLLQLKLRAIQSVLDVLVIV
jgi:hypothetical protein